MTRLLIVSDTRLYREGLQQVLARDGRLEVAGAASSGEEALAAVEAREPQVALVDVALTDAFALTQSLRERAPGLVAVALGVVATEEEILACAEAGFVGYLCREGSVEDLVETVENAVHCRLVCSRRIAAALFRHIAALAERRADPARAFLTPRERQIAELLDTGLSNKEIAKRLTIEVATVKNHVHNILAKLEVHSRSEAVATLRGERSALHPSLMDARRSLGA